MKSSGSTWLGPEAIDALERYAGQLADNGPDLVKGLRASGSSKLEQAAFDLATKHEELRLAGFLLALPSDRRRAVLKLEGGLDDAAAERALESVAVLEAQPWLRQRLAHVWPGAFTPIPTLFVSVSSEDRGTLPQVSRYLATLTRTGWLRLVDYYSASPDESQRLAVLQQADIILLLVSPAYLADDRYFAEMERALARVRHGEPVRVVPVLLEPTPLVGTPIEDLQSLPGNDRTIATGGPSAWLDVEAGIRRVLAARPPRSPPAQAEAGEESRRVFLLCGNRDAEWRERCERGLRPLVRHGYIDLWHEGMVLPGDSLSRTREARFAQADLVLVWMSANLLASDEDTALVRRAVIEKKAVMAIPLDLISQQTLADEGLGKGALASYQPVHDWPNPDSVWASIQDRIRQFQYPT